MPIPKVKSLAELNRRLEEADRRDLARHIGARRLTVGAMGEADRAALHPLPAEPFDAARVTPVRVDRKARVCVRQSFYSVPARFAGRQLTAHIGGTRIEVVEGGTVVAGHERSVVRGSQTLVLDHYLEILARKPGAMPGALATRQARQTGLLTVAHEAFWARARRRWILVRHRGHLGTAQSGRHSRHANDDRPTSPIRRRRIRRCNHRSSSSRSIARRGLWPAEQGRSALPTRNRIVTRLQLCA